MEGRMSGVEPHLKLTYPENSEKIIIKEPGGTAGGLVLREIRLLALERLK